MVEFAVAVPIVLGVAYVIAVIIRRLFGHRLRLPLAAMTLISVGGVSVGLFIAGWFFAGLRVWTPTTIVLAFGCSLGLAFLVAALAVGLRRDEGDVDVDALLRAGESERVEFKETARWNVRTQQRDTRMEHVIAKTVAAFLNSRGGILVIGADDKGEARGLDRDLATLRVPDVDRYELWLRDMFSTLLGSNAAALPAVRFTTSSSGALLCCVVCPPSPRPVYLTQSKDGASTELWVRVGNSTRSFALDEAVDYVARRWRRRAGLARR